MEKHQFERNDQARAYIKFRPTPPHELVEIIINYLKKEVPTPFAKAVDVGCGSGQSTVVLAPYFQSVLGCDVSNAQITEARLQRKELNVEYRIAPAETLPVPDRSVHLLTAATCLHWLDIEKFFKEARRILAPEGVLAVYSSFALYPCTGEDDTDAILKQLTDKIIYDDHVKMYRSPRVQELFQEYENTSFPFDDIVRVRNIYHTYVATAADAAGYIRSMSSFQNFRDAHPQKAEHMLEDYQKRIIELTGITSKPELTPLKYQRNYFLIMCRKSGEGRNVF